LVAHARQTQFDVRTLPQLRYQKVAATFFAVHGLHGPQDMKPSKEDKRIGLDREARDSGIVDPEKDKLADQHSVPGQGDPSIRRKDPDQGSFVTPPLSEQSDKFQEDTRKPAKTDQTENLRTAKGNTQLPRDKKGGKAA
jgi:hypothetical protein